MKTSQTKLNENEIYSTKAVAVIRQHIKNVAPTLSVKKGTGTAAMWIDISGSASEDGRFTDQEKIALYELGITDRPYNLANMESLDIYQRKHLLKLWGYI